MGKTTISPKREISKVEEDEKRTKCLFTVRNQTNLKSETQTILGERRQRKLGSSSEEEHKVNALASGAEEGRD